MAYGLSETAGRQADVVLWWPCWTLENGRYPETRNIVISEQNDPTHLNGAYKWKNDINEGNRE